MLDKLFALSAGHIMENQKLREELKRFTLEKGRMREWARKEVEAASMQLEKAAPGNDQNYWGARMRAFQEMGQKIDAGDFGGNAP